MQQNLSSEYKIALANSIAKTENMMQGSNLNLSRSNNNAFFNALLKQNFSNSIGRYDLEKEAREVGFAHEENPDALGDRYSIEHFKDVEFANSLKADEACDLLNNVQGRIVGITTPEKEMNKIALDVIDKYYTDGFWVSKHIGNGKYKITREKLTEKEYKKIKKNLECLNKNGFKK